MGEKQGHTPGPWRTNGCYISSNYGEVGHAYYVSGMPDGMSEANADLLAAAPDLLAALIEARDALHQHYVDWDGEPEDAVPLQIARAKCDAAIARVSREGGE